MGNTVRFAFVTIATAIAGFASGCSATGIDTEEGLWTPEGAANACPTRAWVGDFVVRTPDDVDTLASYTVITGDLVVEDSTLLDMDGLECLRSVRGNLKVQLNTSLRTLHGLENLYRIGGDLHVTSNPALPSCEAFRLVRRIEDVGWDGTPMIVDNDDRSSCR